MTNSKKENTDRRLPQDILQEASEEFQEHDLGAMTLYGKMGLHTLYAHDAQDFEAAFETAFLKALSETFEDLWVEADIVEEQHGEVTPETVATETVDQIHELTGVRFDGWAREQFEETLAERLHQLTKQP